MPPVTRSRDAVSDAADADAPLMPFTLCSS
jgi:hypothetical protein